MMSPQRRNRLTTHFSERIPVVKRRTSVLHLSNPTTNDADGTNPTLGLNLNPALPVFRPDNLPTTPQTH